MVRVGGAVFEVRWVGVVISWELYSSVSYSRTERLIATWNEKAEPDDPTLDVWSLNFDLCEMIS
jgi:hypothetical protein